MLLPTVICRRCAWVWRERSIGGPALYTRLGRKLPFGCACSHCSLSALSWLSLRICLPDPSLPNPNYYMTGCFPADLHCFFTLEAAASNPVSTAERWRRAVCESGSPVLSWPSPSRIHCPWSQARVLRCRVKTEASGAPSRGRLTLPLHPSSASTPHSVCSGFPCPHSLKQDPPRHNPYTQPWAHLGLKIQPGEVVFPVRYIVLDKFYLCFLFGSSYHLLSLYNIKKFFFKPFHQNWSLWELWEKNTGCQDINMS